MGDITTFEEFDAIMTQEVETDIFENFGEPTTEEFEKIYEEIKEARTKKKMGRGLPTWGAVTGRARAGARGKSAQQLRLYQRKRRMAVRTRAFRKMSPKQRRHLRQLQRTVAKTARVRRKAVRSLGRTQRRAGGFMRRMRGRIGRFIGRRKEDLEGVSNIAEEFMTIALEQDLSPEELALLFTETSFEKLDDNLYLFGIELTNRLIKNDTTQNRFFDWEIDEESDILLYFEDAKDRDVVKKIQEMLEKIGETEIVIIEGDEIEENLLSQFTVFSFFPNKDAFVSLREDFNNAVEEEYYDFFDALTEKIWSAAVTKKAKWSPPKDLFAKGSATEVASTLKSQSKDLKQAMSRLNFYINRAGVKAERKSILNAAKGKLRSLYKKAS